MSPSDLGVFVLATRGAATNEAGGSSAMKGNTEAAVKQAVCTGARNLRALTRVSLRRLPQWDALQGCTAVSLMAEHDNAEQASGQCARACGAVARVRRACLWRAQWSCAMPLPDGGAKARSSAGGQRAVAVCLTSSAASAFVDADHVRSSPLGALWLQPRRACDEPPVAVIDFPFLVSLRLTKNGKSCVSGFVPSWLCVSVLRSSVWVVSLEIRRPSRSFARVSLKYIPL